MKNSFSRRSRGITLLEVVIGMPLLLFSAMIIFSVLKTGMALFARNTSINLAHINLNNAMNRLTQDIHESMTTPLLTNVTITSGTPTFTVVTAGSNGAFPASAGIQVEVYFAGPFQLSGTATATSISMVSSAAMAQNTYETGMHVMIPGQSQNPRGGLVDQTITSFSVSGSTLSCTVSGSTGATITPGGAIVPVYIALQVNYYVYNNRLYRWDNTGSPPSGWNNVAVPNVLTNAPFTSPGLAAPYGGTFFGVHLGATNADYGNRNFVSSDMMFNYVMIPYRGSITP